MINDNKRVLEHFNNLLDKTKENEKVEVYRQNIKYLVNKLEKYFTQTEQLQELTDEIYQHLEDKESLEQQNKRYREALEFYTNEVNHDFEINISITDIEVKSEILEDYGSKARQVLRGE